MKYIFLAERFGEQEYTVNGVRYIVSSSFQSSKVLTSTTIQMTNDIMKGLELLRKQRARSKDAR